MKVELHHKNDLLFEGKNAKDGTLEIGVSSHPENKATRPMELLLLGLAGCSSVDVIGILEKQKQKVSSYSVYVEAERVKSIPAIFKTITISFHLEGEIQEIKAIKAIELSVNKYCSVSHILEPTAQIITQLIINNKEI